MAREALSKALDAGQHGKQRRARCMAYGFMMSLRPRGDGHDVYELCMWYSYTMGIVMGL